MSVTDASPAKTQTISTETIPAGGSWSRIVKKGEIMRIVDLEGQQGVDLLIYNADLPEERYHAANTMKKARTLRLTTGHVLYSDIARPMMTVVADTCGYHDTIAGCCSGPSNVLMYGMTNYTGCRENFLKELARYGLGRKDIVANLNFFCDVPVRQGNEMHPTVFDDGPSKPGDYVELRAEMDILAIISNCPQIGNPCAGGQPTPIEVSIRKG